MTIQHDILAQVMNDILAKERGKRDWTNTDTPIEFEGKKIRLPADPTHMDYDDAINHLERVRDQENQEFDVHELIAGAPWDTLVAVYRAMQDIYGVVLTQSIKTFFGEIRPDFVTVQTGWRSEDRIQVPMGQMQLPNVEAPIMVTMQPQGTVISGRVRRKDRAFLVEIANRAKEVIRTNSVYKSKAIRLNVDGEGELELTQQPEFLPLDHVRETDMIHNDETEALIRTSIFAPLKHTEACRQNRIPLKRGILLEGKYGTGKSLTARVTGKVATDHGWTFIMLNRSQGLRAAIEFARNYQPCVIFAEDIDRAADREEEIVNDLINLLDGVVTKGSEMMVVLTTNFIEKIDKSLLRPGRFDAVISLDAPDENTAQRIIRSYSGPLLDKKADLSAVGEVTAGMIPASIREVVERAKLSMLTEGRKELTTEDLRISAIGMNRHMALLEPKQEAQTPAEKFAEGFVGLVADVEWENVGVSAEELNGAKRHILKHVDAGRKVAAQVLDVAKSGANSAEKARQRTDDIAEHLDIN